MSRFLPLIGALAIAALVVGAPWWYKLDYDRHFRAFHVVHDGVLYRSAQLDIAGLKQVAREYGIRTIVDLRDGYTALDQEEEHWAAANCIKHVRIPPRSWWAINGKAPAEIGLEDFRKVMRDPANHPVLIHCFGGIHRTGTFVAIYRIDFQGWSTGDAMNEMRAMGYSILDEHLDILAFLRNHRPQSQGANTSPHPQPLSPAGRGGKSWQPRIHGAP